MFNGLMLTLNDGDVVSASLKSFSEGIPSDSMTSGAVECKYFEHHLNPDGGLGRATAVGRNWVCSSRS